MSPSFSHKGENSPKSQQNTKENEPMKKIQIYYGQY